MSKTLDEFQGEVGAWGDATFPRSNPATVIAHLTEEAAELRECWMTLPFGSDADVAEAADCLLLLLQYAHKRGFSLYEAAERKMAVNRNRTWETTPEPAGHVKHEEVPS